MKRAVNVKVGDVIEFPHHCFAPHRSGWNGWIFRAGIVEKLYTSKKGLKCATVRYCTRIADRYTMFPNVEATVNLRIEHLFKYDVEMWQNRYTDGIEAEKNGEQVCWSEDIALLVNHGIIK